MEPESIFQHYLPAISVLVILGIWVGRLESITRQLSEQIERLWKEHDAMDQSGSRALGMHLTRLQSDESDIRKLDIRTDELAVRVGEIDRRLSVVFERLRLANDRLDRVVNHALNNHNNNGE